MDSQPKSPSDQVRRLATVAKHISGSTVEFCLSTGKIGILGANKRHSFVPFMCLLGIWRVCWGYEMSGGYLKAQPSREE